MNLPKIGEHKSIRALNQIYHSGCRLAWITPDDKACHQWVICKDFLQDVVAAMLHNKSYGIYGFLYDPAVDPHLDLSKPRLALRFDDVQNYALHTAMQNSSNLLKYFELKWGWGGPSTTVTAYADDTSVFDLNPNWLGNPVLLSICTTLIRQGVNYMATTESLEKILSGEGDSPLIGKEEHTRLANVTKKFPKWWEKFDPKWFDGPSHSDAYLAETVSYLHNHSGYYTLFMGFRGVWLTKVFPKLVPVTPDPFLKEIMASGSTSSPF